jgi:hypothetical protein
LHDPLLLDYASRNKKAETIWLSSFYWITKILVSAIGC